MIEKGSVYYLLCKEWHGGEQALMMKVLYL